MKKSKRALSLILSWSIVMSALIPAFADGEEIAEAIENISEVNAGGDVTDSIQNGSEGETADEKAENPENGMTAANADNGLSLFSADTAVNSSVDAGGAITLNAVGDLCGSRLGEGEQLAAPPSWATDVLEWSNNSPKWAYYEVDMTGKEGGVYEFSADICRQASDAAWGFGEVYVNDELYIYQGKNREFGAVSYDGKDSRYGDFNKYTPGLVTLAGDQMNVLKFRIATPNGKAIYVKDIVLTPVDENTYEMLDENGAAAIGITQATETEKTDINKQSGWGIYPFLWLRGKSITTIDVYTQKAGRYMLYGDVAFTEAVSAEYCFYALNVNGKKIYEKTDNLLGAISAPEVNRRYTLPMGAVDLQAGKNTISFAFQGKSANNTYKLYAMNVEPHDPEAVEIGDDGSLTETIDVLRAFSYDEDPNGFYDSGVDMRFGRGNYFVYKLDAPEAGFYDLAFNVKVFSNNANISAFGFKVSVGDSADSTTAQISNGALIENDTETYAVGTTHTENAGRIKLNAGVNYLKVESAGGNSNLVLRFSEFSLRKYVPEITDGKITVDTTDAAAEEFREITSAYGADMIFMRGGNSNHYGIFKVVAPEDGTYKMSLDFKVNQNNNGKKFGFKVSTAQSKTGTYSERLSNAELCTNEAYPKGGPYSVVAGVIPLSAGENYIRIEPSGGDSQLALELYRFKLEEYIDPVVTLDEDNANNPAGKGSVTSNVGMGIASESVSSTAANGGSYRKISYTESPVFTYKPKLSSGRYMVLVNKPYIGKKAYDTVQTDKINIDFNSITADITHSGGTSSVRYTNSPGSRSGWYSLGTYEFTGTDADEVKLTGDSLEKFKNLVRYQQDGAVRNNADRLAEVLGDVIEAVCYIDAVKFVPIDGDEVTDEVIIDQSGRTALNPVYSAEIPAKAEFEAAENNEYGYALLEGADFANSWAGEMFGSIDMYGGVFGLSWGTYSSKNDAAMKYVPRLTEGFYRVYTSRPDSVKASYPQNAATMRAEVKSSFGTDTHDYVLNAVNDSQWEYLGIYHFSGVFGEDMVTLGKVSGNYYMFDAVKFVRVPSLAPADISVETPDVSAPSVLRDSKFSLVSDINLDTSTVSGSTVKLIRKDTGAEVEAAVEIDGQGLEITLTPAAEMTDGVRYAIEISGVKDKFQRDASAKSFEFLVDLDTQSPTAVITATSVSGGKVALDSAFDISFSETVFGLEKKSGYSLISADGKEADIEVLVTEEGRRVRIIPTSVLKADTEYTLVINSGIYDKAGNPTGSGGVLKFTTALSGNVNERLTAQLTGNPSISETNPNASWTIMFSAAMTQEYMSEQFMYIAKDDGTRVATKVERASEHAVKLSPVNQLESNSTYRIVLVPSIRSRSGYALKDMYEFSFKTRFTDELPQPLSLLTNDGGTVSSNQTVYAKFSTALDLRTIKTENVVVKKNGAAVNVKLSAVDTKTIGISSAGEWAEGEYTVELSSSIASIEGNTLSDSASFGFRVVGKTLENVSASISGSHATGAADYTNNSAAEKKVRGMLVVYENGVAAATELSAEQTAAAGATVTVSAEITNAAAFGSDAYARFIVFESFESLRPASSAKNNVMTAELAKSSGVTIDISGKVTGENGVKNVVYLIKNKAADSIVYVGNISTDAAGSFDISYTIPNSQAPGEYTVKLGADGVASAMSFSFNNISEYLEREARKALNNAIATGDTDEIENIIKQSGVLFGIPSEAAKLLEQLPQKTEILNSITSADTCADEVLMGLAKHSSAAQIKNTAAALAQMAGLSESDIAEMNSADVCELFAAAKPFADKSDIAKAMRSAIAIQKIKTKSTSEYSNILRAYASDLGITVPATVTQTLKDGLYSIRNELTVRNFAEKFGGLSNTPAPGPYDPGSGGGNGGGSGATIITSSGLGGSTTGTTENTPQNAVQSVFGDLGSVPWAQTAIAYLYKNGVISGVADGVFAPNDTVTREQFVKMMVLALGIPAGDGDVSFADVDMNEWYGGYIRAAVSAGIVTGYSDEMFGTGDCITREDMAVMMNRAIEGLGISIAAKNSKTEFADGESISEHAKQAVEALTEYGLMNGIGNDCFEPLSDSTRAMAAKMIYELLIHKTR